MAGIVNSIASELDAVAKEPERWLKARTNMKAQLRVSVVHQADKGEASDCSGMIFRVDDDALALERTRERGGNFECSSGGEWRPTSCC